MAKKHPSIMQVTFRNPIRYQHQKELFIAPEGLYTGQVGSLAIKETLMGYRALRNCCSRPMGTAPFLPILQGVSSEDNKI